MTLSLSIPEQDLVRWFERRGLGLFLRDTGIGGGTSTRAAPALVVEFVLAMLLVIPAATEATLVGVLPICLAVLALVWVGGNLLRRKPPLAPISRIGPLEVVAFVVAPIVAMGLVPQQPIVLEGFEISTLELRLSSIAVVGVLQAVVLAVVWVIVANGIDSLSIYLFRHLWRTLGNAATALATTLPVLLGVVFFFFLNPGVWVSIGRLPPVPYSTVCALLLVLAALFLGSRSQLDLDPLTRFDTADDLRSALVGTPLEDRPVELTEPVVVPLERRQRLNARAVGVISRMVVGTVIALGVFCFFVVLGYLAVDEDTVKGWTRVDPHVLLRFTTRAHAYILSTEHLRIAGFLACFAALNFSLASATDARLRHGAQGAAEDVIRQAAGVRLWLLSARENAGPRLAADLPPT